MYRTALATLAGLTTGLLAGSLPRSSGPVEGVRVETRSPHRLGEAADSFHADTYGRIRRAREFSTELTERGPDSVTFRVDASRGYASEHVLLRFVLDGSGRPRLEPHVRSSTCTGGIFFRDVEGWGDVYTPRGVAWKGEVPCRLVYTLRDPERDRCVHGDVLIEADDSGADAPR
jgi:hypothetical protein